ncbi:hypothetical protein EON80_21015, partial [bacterium]
MRSPSPMKFPRPLPTIGGALLLLLAARMMAPRASLAQSSLVVPPTASKPRLPAPPHPLPPDPLEGSFYQGWGAVENLSAMRGNSLIGDSTLWAIQKSAVAIAPQKFKARLWINGLTPVGKMKVIFHSQFTDGSPCGTWDEVYPHPPGPATGVERDSTGFECSGGGPVSQDKQLGRRMEDMAFKLGLATLAFGAMLLGSSTSFAADWRGPTQADARWGGQERHRGGWEAPRDQAFRYVDDDAKTRRFMGCRGPNCNYGPMPRPVDSRGRYELQTVERWVPARYE